MQSKETKLPSLCCMLGYVINDLVISNYCERAYSPIKLKKWLENKFELIIFLHYCCIYIIMTAYRYKDSHIL